jgi:hypothetical protein
MRQQDLENAATDWLKLLERRNRFRAADPEFDIALRSCFDVLQKRFEKDRPDGIGLIPTRLSGISTCETDLAA